jgi:hypothetical protein
MKSPLEVPHFDPYPGITFGISGLFERAQTEDEHMVQEGFNSRFVGFDENGTSSDFPCYFVHATKPPGTQAVRDVLGVSVSVPEGDINEWLQMRNLDPFAVAPTIGSALIYAYTAHKQMSYLYNGAVVRALNSGYNVHLANDRATLSDGFTSRAIGTKTLDTIIRTYEPTDVRIPFIKSR